MKISANLRSSRSASIPASYPASYQLLWRDVGLVPFFTKGLGINIQKKNLTAKAMRKK